MRVLFLHSEKILDIIYIHIFTFFIDKQKVISATKRFLYIH